MAVKNLKVAIVPLDIHKDDKLLNLQQADERLSAIEPGTDLVVLPELFTTGFRQDSDALMAAAETNTGQTIQNVTDWARRGGFAVWGSFLARTGSSLYNRGFMIEPSGEEVFYDKAHLFSMGGEDKLLRRGADKSPVVRYRGWNLRMAICYDLRFPVWLRNKGLEFDALIVPANWPDKRAFPWKQLLTARAIENQCYVLGANRGGADEYGEYPLEMSVAFDHWGRETGERRPDGTVYVTLEADRLGNDRQRFAPWRDADDFELKD